MPICLKCNSTFKSRIIINGQKKNLGQRKYCLDCSPFNGHNTKQLHLSKDNSRYCSKCGETDPSRFYGNKKHYCSKCHKEHTNQSQKKNKQKAIEYLGGKCRKCQYSKCIAALEFHHKNPKEKDPNFKYILGWSWERIKKELDICILLCANCHREIHYCQ